MGAVASVPGRAARQHDGGPDAEAMRSAIGQLTVRDDELPPPSAADAAQAAAAVRRLEAQLAEPAHKAKARPTVPVQVCGVSASMGMWIWLRPMFAWMMRGPQ